MRYKIREEILWKLIDGETVIVDPNKDSYSYLNSTGTQVWKMLNEEYPIPRIEKELADRYDVPESTLKKDVADIIDKLLNQELIEKIDDE